MDFSAEQKELLREALGHLYDPSYRTPAVLCVALGCKPDAGADSVRGVILRAIASLQPRPNVPADARLRRAYALLDLRYVQNLTSEETAQRLGITSRHLRREQQEALGLLGRRLQEQAEHDAPEGAGPTPAAEMPGGSPFAADRRTQLQHELASLRKSAPGSWTSVSETLRSALDVGQVLAAGHGIGLSLGAIPEDLAAAIHPSALRQALLMAVNALAGHMAGGQISLATRQEPDRVTISVAGRPADSTVWPDTDLIEEILAAQGGSLALAAEGDQIAFCLQLPLAHEITVLVVDDNPDVVHFYRRFTERTRYRILHAASGQHALEMVAAARPDIVVLDIMLPDLDGWQLLSHLHEDPVSRDIPIVVCSVIYQVELAVALGAAQCLAKPVWRSDFVAALDRAAAGQPPLA